MGYYARAGLLVHHNVHGCVVAGVYALVSDTSGADVGVIIVADVADTVGADVGATACANRGACRGFHVHASGFTNCIAHNGSYICIKTVSPTGKLPSRRGLANGMFGANDTGEVDKIPSMHSASQPAQRATFPLLKPTAPLNSIPPVQKIDPIFRSHY